MKKLFKRIFLVTVISAALMSVLTLAAAAQLRGDIDLNGEVSSDDARTALRISVGLESPAFEVFDRADIDMNAVIEPSDARTILRISVALDPEVPYYTPVPVSEAPSCRGEVQLNRVNSEDSSDSFIQTYPALPHDFSIKVPSHNPGTPTCIKPVPVIYKCSGCDELYAKDVYGEHVLSEATCTLPPICTVCQQRVGTALGHTTGIGYCERCGVYIDTLINQRKAVVNELNNSRKAFIAAYDELFTNRPTDKAELAKKANITRTGKLKTTVEAYDKAISACGSYGDFKAIKDILSVIRKELNSLTGSAVTSSDVDSFILRFDKIYNATMSTDPKNPGYNLQIKEITDSQKP